MSLLSATAVGEISNKTGELIGKVTPLSAEDGPVHKLAGGFGVVTDAGQKVIEKNGEMITSLASINRAMLESIEVAYKLQAALAAAASGGTKP